MPKRSLMIPPSKQIEIAQYYLANPKESHLSVSKKFNVTKHQLRYAVQKYSRDEFDEAKKETFELELERKKITAIQDLKTHGAVRLVDNLIVTLIANLEMNPDMPINEQFKYVNQLTTAMKRLQDLQFVEALKKPDAKIMFEMMRQLKPDITEHEMITLWKKAATTI